MKRSENQLCHDKNPPPLQQVSPQHAVNISLYIEANSATLLPYLATFQTTKSVMFLKTGNQPENRNQCKLRYNVLLCIHSLHINIFDQSDGITAIHTSDVHFCGKNKLKTKNPIKYCNQSKRLILTF